ncbi:MAG: winged helix DNA-binding protein [Ignavibacteria bacterium]|jgi:DNA-binding MarR family transcriptional regulator
MAERIFDIITNLKKKCMDKEESIQKEYLLSPAEYNGILSVTPDEIYSCNQLSKKMGLSVSRSSRVLERLIKNGYLKGIRNENDRRELKVTLTEKGRNTRNKINKKLEECEKDIINKLQKSELYILENTLNKLSDVFIS